MNDVNDDCLATSEVTTQKISELQEEIEPTTSEINGRRKLESLNYGNSHHLQNERCQHYEWHTVPGWLRLPFVFFRNKLICDCK